MTRIQKNSEGFNEGLKVSSEVELSSVRLLSMSCEQKPEMLTDEKEYNIKYSTDFSLDDDNKFIAVIPKFTFTAFTEINNPKPSITIKASFLLAYTLKSTEGLTKQGYKEFAKMNGIYNAWPYWRELIQNTIARMELPPLTIPVFRVTAQPEPEITQKKLVSKKKVAKKKSKKV